MYPYIHILNKDITTYSLMALIGVLVAGFFACHLIRKKEDSDYNMIFLLLVSGIGSFIGSHLLYGIINIRIIIKAINNSYLIDSFSKFIDLFVYVFGGAVFYGGLLGALLFGAIYIKKKNLKNYYIDIAAIIIPLFHFFGRIGCFLVGCCYGVESKIGFTYENAIVESANHVHRFPIQLVESFYNLLLFFLLYYLYKKEKIKGNLIYLYLLLYGVARFIFEFFRGDTYRGFLFGLSTSSIISIIIVISVIVILIVKCKKHQILTKEKK